MSVGLIRSIELAEIWFRPKKRQWSGDPYIVHLLEVARALSEFHAPSEVVCAGVLHDILEDTEIGLNSLRLAVGETVAGLVVEVTDVYTTKAYPHLNRTSRKMLESDRLGGVSRDAKAIKCADIVSNTRSIVRDGPSSFVRLYLAEIGYLLPKLAHSYPLLWSYTKEVYDEAVDQFRRKMT